MIIRLRSLMLILKIRQLYVRKIKKVRNATNRKMVLFVLLLKKKIVKIVQSLNCA